VGGRLRLDRGQDPNSSISGVNIAIDGGGLDGR
jgi:hypothetical protein